MGGEQPTTEPDLALPILIYRHLTNASQHEVEHELDEDMLNAYLSRTDSLMAVTGSHMAAKLMEALSPLITALLQR